MYIKSKDDVSKLDLSNNEINSKTRKKTGWSVFMSWFINDLKECDYEQIKEIVEKENLRGELYLTYLYIYFHSYFAYPFTGAPFILPQRLDDEAGGGATLRDAYSAGASVPDSRPPSTSFRQLNISSNMGGKLTGSRNDKEKWAEPCPKSSSDSSSLSSGSPVLCRVPLALFRGGGLARNIYSPTPSTFSSHFVRPMQVQLVEFISGRADINKEREWARRKIFRFKAGELQTLAGIYWRRLSEEIKEAWKDRAGFLNLRDIPGELKILTSVVTDAVILSSVNLEIDQL